jgi:uncharacterized protein
MNSCEAEGFRLGRFHPTVDIDSDLLGKWRDRHVFALGPCAECSVALLCGGGCTRLAQRGGGDLQDSVVCPPMANIRDLQVLVDYYLPKIVEAQSRRDGR